jgi:hypothetical protein
MISTHWPKSLELYLDKESPFKYLVQEPGFFEFEFLGHVFGIAISKDWQNYYKNLYKEQKKLK